MLLLSITSLPVIAQRHSSSSHSYSSRSYSSPAYHSSSGSHSRSSSSYHSSTGKRSTGSHSYTPHSSTGHRSTYSTSAPRNSNGRIKRSSSARYSFMKQTGYVHGRKGYVIDHIKPLKEGGCDCPSNMQWQTKEAAKAKDKWE